MIPLPSIRSSELSDKQISKICELYRRWILAEEEDADSIADELDEAIAKVNHLENLRISQALEKRKLPPLQTRSGWFPTLDRSAREALRESCDKKSPHRESVRSARRPIKVEKPEKKRRKRQREIITQS